ncbi:MAG: TIGR02710 family CRISPR-associated CARF protein [bacterium]|nr:TIGR02710 family CRISPR-associated CARF protein [bacterium]
MRYMLVTVGTGRNREDIAEAILKSIRNHNPDKVIFFCTDKSSKETIPFIEGKYRNFDKIILEDENDIESIKQKCDEEIGKLKKEKDIYIIVDYTSGTKAMSAGIILSAIENDVDNISYIAGKRDEGGRVIPGTERVISFYPTQIYSKKLYLEGIKYFNNLMFESAKNTFKTAIKLYEGNDIGKKAKLLIKLCDAYLNWDLFSHKEALKILNEVSKEEISLLSSWGIKSRVEKHKELLYKLANEQFSIEKMLDLLKNAERRFIEGKYDDCVARLYRLIEYIIQFRIAEKNLYVKKDNIYDTSEINLNNIPEDLRSKYGRPLGLEASAKLLKELRDDLGSEICNNEELKKILSARNYSILAHGLNPIGKETSEAFLNLIKSLILELVKTHIKKAADINFDQIYNQLDFPRIKETIMK